MACRECIISAAVGFALDVCEQEKIDVPSLQKIYKEGYESEEEVWNSLIDFNNHMPEERKVESESIKCFAFQERSECKVILKDQKL